MKGRIYVCAEIEDILTDQALNNDSNGRSAKDLSYREIEIIKLIKKGLSSKEIALKLGITIRTVEVHRYNILKKLKLKNIAALINFINTTEPFF